MPYVIAIADDLTGAAESAAALAGLPVAGPPALGEAVVLSPASEELPDHDVVVLDTDTRSAPADEASAATVEAVARAFSYLGGDGRGSVVKKLDSMLRGNTARELQAISGRWPMLLAPALPVQGRTVIDGTLTAGGRRHRLADLLPAAHAFPVTLRDVRGPAGGLVATLRSALHSGSTPIMDAETDADLDAVAAAVAELPRVVLAGSGGLASAIGRRRLADRLWTPPARPVAADGSLRRIVTVVGTAEPGARLQLKGLEDAGVAVRLLRADALLDDAWTVGEGPAEGHLAYAIDGPVRDGDGIPQRLSASLATRVLASHPDADFVVTGGQTAKALLTALGESVLFPAAVVHPGAIINFDRAGRIVATRPGSFGSADSLAQMLTAVALLRTRAATTTTRKGLP
jgi:D-threonate/D-erythronate kinase